MKQLFLTIALAACAAISSAQSKVTYTTDVTRDVSKTSDSPTLMRVSTNILCEKFKRSSEEAISTGLSAGTIKFAAVQGTSGTLYMTSSYGTYGYWFTASGLATTATKSVRRFAVQYASGYFKFIHNNEKCLQGEEYSASVMFIQNTDTVEYRFNVTMGSSDAIDTDQPAYQETIEHREDEVDAWGLQPMVRRNDGEWMKQQYVQVKVGDKISFSMADKGGNTVSRVLYKDKNGTQLRGYKADPEYVYTESATADMSGFITSSIIYKDEDGASHTQAGLRIYIDVQEEELGTPFSWEGRVPKFFHDWKNDAQYNYGVYTKPEKLHSVEKKDGTAANVAVGDWWSVFWGDDCNSECGDAATTRKAAENMVKKYDDDFAYIRDYMGWPPDLSARRGYKSFVYIFGSGLANDNTPKTEAGGYQGNLRIDGGDYACVWASYYPFSRFRDDADKKWNDGDYQREAMIHEGIHAIFADIDACKKSAWFHEAGNTWLQSAMNTERYNKYGTPGFLDACPLVAPFMPIECYSGWLLDGSFGGPTAEGVNMYNSAGQQVCTWRNLLGGNQYGNSFPIILGEICGKGSIPWIWRNCTDYVLKGIGNHLGEETMRQLILQYRARMATFDIGGWKTGYRKIMNDNIGLSIKEEYGNGVIDKENPNSGTMPCSQHVEPFKLTPYQGLKKNTADNWLAPDPTTNPGWSGSNIIPIHVDSKANSATVEFMPQNDKDMRAQLCYVTKAGKIYYSQPIHCGKTMIDLTDRPANNVVFFVVANTDYIYSNDNNQEQRKAHYDYRVRFGEGALAVADLYTKWSLNESTLKDASYDEDKARDEQNIALGIKDIVDDSADDGDTYYPGQNGVKLLTGLCSAGTPITVSLANGISPDDVTVNIFGLSGIVEDEAPLNGNSYTLPANLTPGLYFIKFIQRNGKVDTYKVIVK